MAYDSTKPAGGDPLRISDDTIRANFIQIVANFSNQHVWSDDTAASVVHNRACGIIARNMAATITPVNEDLSFTPNMVLFNYFYVSGGVTVEQSAGVGQYKDLTDRSHGHYTANATDWNVVEGEDPARAIIFLDSAGNLQRATCSFSTNKFSLAWTKVGSPTGTAYIRYTAFG